MKDNLAEKRIGKRYRLYYSCIFPLKPNKDSKHFYHLDGKRSYFHEIENKWTILEYCGDGAYKDLITNEIILDISHFKIELAQQCLFGWIECSILSFFHEIDYEKSVYELSRVSEEEKEKIKKEFAMAKLKTLKNSIEDLTQPNPQKQYSLHM